MKLQSKLFLSTVCFLEAYCCNAQASQKSEQENPNIIFIQCDQLNAKALNCYGGPVPTPNLDWLASRGVRFTNAICSTPTSSPSRASTVTSLYTHQHGVVQNIPKLPGITEQDITTDKILHENGWDTHQYGKWHLENEKGMDLSYYPDSYSFKDYRNEVQDELKKMYKAEKGAGEWMHYYEMDFPVELSEHFRKLLPELDKKWEKRQYREFVMKMGRLRMDGDRWHDKICADKTIEIIKKSSKKNTPFSVACSFIWPHDPNFINNPYYDSINPDTLPISTVNHIEEYYKKNWGYEIVDGIGEKGKREFARIYLASIKYIDDQIGNIIEALKNTKQLDNTIIIFTSDHGDMFTSHSMIWKSTIAFYREVVNIPLIISYPKMLPVNVTCNAQTNVIDYMPTILELAGLPIPEHIEGKSLVPVMTGKISEKAFRKYNFCERIQVSGGEQPSVRGVQLDQNAEFMVQTDDWKYVIHSNGLEFMYDLNNDAQEVNNLAKDSKYKEVKSEMHAAIVKWLKDTGWKGLAFPFKNMQIKYPLSEKNKFNFVIGTQSVGAKYKFTKNTNLVETANQIWSMGSNLLKISMSPRYCSENYDIPKDNKIKSLADLAKEKSFDKVLNMPFAYYQIWAYEFSQYTKEPKGVKKDENQIKFINGYSDENANKTYKEIYDLASYLLKKYSGTGKTFLLGNWEGDWHLFWDYDASKPANPKTIKGMIKWFNVRQKAIDDAKKDTPHNNVNLFHYVEVNNSKLAVEGKPCVINSVLPYISPDYVSFSSYTATNPPKNEVKMKEKLIQALDLINSKLKPKKGIEGKRVFIGEYGWPEHFYDTKTIAERAKWVIKAALEWETPYILFWEMYNNEILPDGSHKGFWLINKDGEKMPLYYLHKSFYAEAKKYISRYNEKYGKYPTHSQFCKAALNFKSLK